MIIQQPISFSIRAQGSTLGPYYYSQGFKLAESGTVVQEWKGKDDEEYRRIILHVRGQYVITFGFV